MLNKILFVLRARIANKSRVSWQCYIKNPKNIFLGRNSKVHSNCTLDAVHEGGIRIGNRVTLNRYAYLQGSRGGITVGDGSEINNYAVINGAGQVAIGENVLIGPHAQIISYHHNYGDIKKPIKDQGLDYQPISIGNDVWIGANAVILAGVEIGQGCIIGAGSVVTHSFPPLSVVAGVPARLLKSRTDVNS